MNIKNILDQKAIKKVEEKAMNVVDKAYDSAKKKIVKTWIQVADKTDEHEEMSLYNEIKRTENCSITEMPLQKVVIIDNGDIRKHSPIRKLMNEYKDKIIEISPFFVLSCLFNIVKSDKDVCEFVDILAEERQLSKTAKILLQAIMYYLCCYEKTESSCYSILELVRKANIDCHNKTQNIAETGFEQIIHQLESRNESSFITRRYHDYLRQSQKARKHAVAELLDAFSFAEFFDLSDFLDDIMFDRRPNLAEIVYGYPKDEYKIIKFDQYHDNTKNKCYNKTVHKYLKYKYETLEYADYIREDSLYGIDNDEYEKCLHIIKQAMEKEESTRNEDIPDIGKQIIDSTKDLIPESKNTYDMEDLEFQEPKEDENIQEKNNNISDSLTRFQLESETICHDDQESTLETFKERMGLKTKTETASGNEPEPEKKEEDQHPANPLAIKKFLDEEVIGQEKAKISLSVALANHMKAYENNLPSPRGTTLLIGPTGSGKTMLARKLSEYSNLPITIFDTSQITANGWHGMDTCDVVKDLYKENDAQIAEYGIVVLDEFDKLCKNPKTGIVGQYARKDQEALLGMLDGTPLHDMNSRSDEYGEIYQTKNLLFIITGSFDEMTKEEEKETHIGFGTVSNMSDKDIRQRLLHYGIIDELVGRITSIVMTEPLTTEEMVSALMDSNVSFTKQYERILSTYGLELQLSKNAVEEAVKASIPNGLGVRGARNILDEKFRYALFDTFKDKANCVVIGDQDETTEEKKKEIQPENAC